MTVTFRLNPPEHDENGAIFDYEKTWICFNMTIKKAEDRDAADDVFDFIEWHLYEKSDVSCEFMRDVKCENGRYSDVLTFGRDKRRTKQAQIEDLRYAMNEAKMAWYWKLSTATPPFILAATKTV